MHPRVLALLTLLAVALVVAPGAQAAQRAGAAKAKPTAAAKAKAKAAVPKPTLGFADQKPLMFADLRWLLLGTKQARINVPWDVLYDPPTLANLDLWMRGARITGVRPLLTIDRSRREQYKAANPTAGSLAAQVGAWRKRWPGQVNEVSTWNEGNINKSPELVASWWLALRKSCKGCTVLGADVVDRPNAGAWAKRFVRFARREPTVWGLHNYVDSNNFRTSGTRSFLKAVKGKVWLTETGGVLARAHPVSTFSGTGAAHAAKAISFLFKRLLPIDPKRMSRVYLYSWSTTATDLTWDSGFVGPDGKERPALQLVRCYIGKCDAKPAVTPVPAPVNVPEVEVPVPEP